MTESRPPRAGDRVGSSRTSIFAVWATPGRRVSRPRAGGSSRNRVMRYRGQPAARAKAALAVWLPDWRSALRSHRPTASIGTPLSPGYRGIVSRKRQRSEAQCPRCLKGSSLCRVPRASGSLNAQETAPISEMGSGQDWRILGRVRDQRPERTSPALLDGN
jgi:hypothetical protein